MNTANPKCPCGLQPCDTCMPPPTLYAELTSSCSGWSGSLTLFNPGYGTWTSGLDPGPPQIVELFLSCFDGAWIVSINARNAECGIDGTPADSWACEPSFRATFTVALNQNCCPTSGGTLSVEIHE